MYIGYIVNGRKVAYFRGISAWDMQWKSLGNIENPNVISVMETLQNKIEQCVEKE